MNIDPAFAAHLEELTLRAHLAWVLAGVSALALVGFALIFPSRRRGIEGGGIRQRLSALHRSESAIASMEFLMVLFPFVVIVMTVWQLAFMFNAQIHVGYAAYTAARSAAVMIPADFKNEKEWQIKPEKASKAEKWKRIRRAAIPGLIPVSPGNMEDAVKVLGVAALTKKDVVEQIPKDPALVARLGLMGAHYGNAKPFSGTRVTRSAAKDLYAQSATRVLINGMDHKKAQNLKGQDSIQVEVQYLFYLNVPYVGKLMQTAIEGLNGPLRPYPSIVLSETMHMKLWSRKRAIEPC